jgi:hypothetical protein
MNGAQMSCEKTASSQRVRGEIVAPAGVRRFAATSADLPMGERRPPNIHGQIRDPTFPRPASTSTGMPCALPTLFPQPLWMPAPRHRHG